MRETDPTHLTINNKIGSSPSIHVVVAEAGRISGLALCHTKNEPIQDRYTRGTAP